MVRCAKAARGALSAPLRVTQALCPDGKVAMVECPDAMPIQTSLEQIA